MKKVKITIITVIICFIFTQTSIFYNHYIPINHLISNEIESLPYEDILPCNDNGIDEGNG